MAALGKQQRLVKQCPNCGGSVSYDPKAMVARCPFCSTELPLDKLIQRKEYIEKGPPSRKRVFPWKAVVVIWLVSVLVFLLLSVMLSTKDRESTDWIRSEKAYQLFEYDALIGFVILILVGAARGIIRGVKTGLFRLRTRKIIEPAEKENIVTSNWRENIFITASDLRKEFEPPEIPAEKRTSGPGEQSEKT